MKLQFLLSNFARRAVRRGLCLSLTAMLVGCESVPQLMGVMGADPQASWQAHLQWLESIEEWRTSGRVAVQVPDDGWSASLRWRQKAQDYQIRLSGPFGQGAVRVDGTAGGVVLRTADGRRRHAANAEQLIAAELGAEVPVSLLRYWLLGRPAPAIKVDELQLDADGLLQELSQAGWAISYQDYETHKAGLLPVRLRIGRGQSKARFVLGDWHTTGRAGQ
jgi:outer membrane lipoprotein LolB